MLKRSLSSIFPVLLAVVVVNFISAYLFVRFDLTEDRRYTLSEAAIATVSAMENPVIIDVLLAGELPSEFERLRIETELLLEEFSAVNDNIKFNFIDPIGEDEQREATIRQLQNIGLTPASVTTEDSGRVSQELLFPWAMVNSGRETVKVSLLKNKLGASTEERINNSVQNLEYGFADAFAKLQINEKKKIAVLKGNGELDDIYIADFLTSIRDYYNIGAITLDSVTDNPQAVLDQLKQFDMMLVAKPTTTFSDEEKYILDQFMVQGGRSLWLIDQVNMELDSLFNEEGKALALARDLNLKDMFFRYGLRIKPDLINDLYFTQIVLATGDAAASQYSPVPWYYNPMVFSADDHPTNNKLEALRFQFTGSMDTLENDYKKTVLYKSSPLSISEATPRQISLDMINTPPDKNRYEDGGHILAVLVEGTFQSAFRNRVKPIDLDGVSETGVDSKLIVISDGDLIKNQLSSGRPLELGYDKWTNNFYGNKEFLINCVNYLLDDTGLINIRNKQVRIPLLDPEKIENQRTKWQLINIGAPLIIVIIFGWLYNVLRRRKYSA